MNPQTNKVYVSNYGNNTISVIDGNSNKVTNIVKVGTYPKGVAVNSLTNRIYVANYDNSSVSVIAGY